MKQNPESNINDVDMILDETDTTREVANNHTDTPITNDKNKTTYKKSKKYCNNCGKFGHYFRECKYPITSYGIICFKITPYPLAKNQRLEPHNIKYLAIRRRNTLSYVEFVRGKYKYTDIKFLKTLFSRMTVSERKDILECNFDELWNKLWINNRFKKMNKMEFNRSKKRFLDLRMGVSINSIHISVESLMKITQSKYIEPEWTFPKGRRNCYENDLDCAQREFQEEANLISDDYELFNMVTPFIEEHIGTNNISYRTVYYLALCTSDDELKINPENPAQLGEVSAIGWFSYADLTNNLIRWYSDERKKCISKIHKIILNKFNENL